MKMNELVNHFKNAHDVQVSIHILYMSRPGIQKVNIQVTGKRSMDGKTQLLSRFINTDVSKMSDIIRTLILSNIQINNEVQF